MTDWSLLLEEVQTRAGEKLRNVAAVVAFLIAIPPMNLNAQAANSSTDQRHLWYYAFGAPGVWFNRYCTKIDIQDGLMCLEPSWRAEVRPHVGGGLELQPSKILGVSADGGVTSSNGYWGGIGSINGTYSFKNALDRSVSFVPFITAGYSIDPDSRSGFNAGGGVHYWGKGNKGLRVEARGHSWKDGRFVEVRIGVEVAPR